MLYTILTVIAIIILAIIVLNLVRSRGRSIRATRRRGGRCIVAVTVPSWWAETSAASRGSGVRWGSW